jgi:hypothetical protein
MYFSKSYAAILMALVITACSKHPLTKAADGNGSKDGLVGAWQWVRTDGGIGYNIHQTPLSTGKQVALKLVADSTYAVYTNNIITSHGTYRIEMRTCIHDHNQKPFLLFSAGNGLMIEAQNTDSLILSDENMDGVESIYKRDITGIK